MITLTDEEFEVVYEALRLANSPYTNEDVPHLVATEAKAWTAVQAARHRSAHGE